MAESLSFPSAVRSSPGEAAPSVPGLHLRPARTADLPFLRRLYRATRERELQHLGWPEEVKRAFCQSQFDAQHLDYTNRYPQAWFLLVEEKRVPIGRLYADFSGTAAHLIDIALLPAGQGRGVGGRILVSLQDRAAATGRVLRLSVERMNGRAAALYARHGFLPEAEGPTHLHLSWTPGNAG